MQMWLVGRADKPAQKIIAMGARRRGHFRKPSRDSGRLARCQVCACSQNRKPNPALTTKQIAASDRHHARVRIGQIALGTRAGRRHDRRDDELRKLPLPPATQGSPGRSVVDAGTCQDRRRTLIPRRFSQYIFVVAGCWQRDDAELDWPRYSCSRSGAGQLGKLATLCRNVAVPRCSRFAHRCGASCQLAHLTR